MPDFLVFTLTAALGSMGELAGHERRGTWTWPGRSAVLGLLAAARGIRRDGDFSAVDRLSVAVAIFDEGQFLRDYHTVQTVPSAAAKRPQSRPEALRLAGSGTNTTITLRDYRAGPLCGVAVTGSDELPTLAEALRRPAFSLYLGRKSCPLAAPLAPRIVSAADTVAALTHVQLPPWRSEAVARLLAVDVTDGHAGRIETRHDVPLDRGLWHFARREVRLMPVEIRPAGGEVA